MRLTQVVGVNIQEVVAVRGVGQRAIVVDVVLGKLLVHLAWTGIHLGVLVEHAAVFRAVERGGLLLRHV